MDESELISQQRHDARMKLKADLDRVTAERDALKGHLRWALAELKDKAEHTIERSDMLGRGYVCRYCGAKTHTFVDSGFCPYYEARAALQAAGDGKTEETK